MLQYKCRLSKIEALKFLILSVRPTPSESSLQLASSSSCNCHMRTLSYHGSSAFRTLIKTVSDCLIGRHFKSTPQGKPSPRALNCVPPITNRWSDWSPQKRVNRDKLNQRQKMILGDQKNLKQNLGGQNARTMILGGLTHEWKLVPGEIKWVFQSPQYSLS